MKVEIDQYSRNDNIELESVYSSEYELDEYDEGVTYEDDEYYPSSFAYENYYSSSNTLRMSKPIPIPITMMKEPRKREFIVLKCYSRDNYPKMGSETKTIDQPEIDMCPCPHPSLSSSFTHSFTHSFTQKFNPDAEYNTDVSTKVEINKVVSTIKEIQKLEEEDKLFTLVEKKKKTKIAEQPIAIEKKYYFACQRENCKFGMNCMFAHTFEQFNPTSCKFDKKCRNFQNCTFKHSSETKSEYIKRRGIKLIKN